MRKPRDFDAELKALNNKAKLLKDRKLQQLGELVIATGADVLPVEQLAGALLSAAESGDAGAKESWRKRGTAFFQRARTTGRETDEYLRSTTASDGSTPPSASKNGT